MKKQLCFIVSLFILPFAFAIHPTDNEVNTKDTKFLRDWFRSKRAVSIKEKGGDLFLSADVRTEYENLSAKFKETRSASAPWVQEYNNSSNPFGDDQFHSEVNIYLDYRTSQTWASIRLKFNNFMGSLGGQTNDLALDKAFFGYRLFEDGATIFDINIGRNKLYNWFDSKVQYNTLFDGILLIFATVFDQVLDFEVRAGGTVVDFVTNNFGYIVQATMSNIANSGLFVKYSYTNWNRDAATRIFGPMGRPVTGALLRHNPQVKFGISQMILGYELDPEVLHFPVRFYAAYLYNHLARIRQERNPMTGRRLFGNNRRAWGFYAGITAGVIEKRGDWALQANYQAVSAQAIPNWDVSGIGLGNPAGADVYGAIYNAAAPGSYSSTFTDFPIGNTNYCGWDFQFLYAVTNNISILGVYDFSQELSNSFTVQQKFHLLEIEAIYAF